VWVSTVISGYRGENCSGIPAISSRRFRRRKADIEKLRLEKTDRKLSYF
jgi:hypothetical protein